MVKLRLKRLSVKNRPFYRLVAAEAKTGRDGPYIEAIGTYDPICQPSKVEIDHEKAMKWLLVRAQPTETAAILSKRTGVLDDFFVQRPKARKKYRFLNVRNHKVKEAYEALISEVPAVVEGAPVAAAAVEEAPISEVPAAVEVVPVAAISVVEIKNLLSQFSSAQITRIDSEDGLQHNAFSTKPVEVTADTGAETQEQAHKSIAGDTRQGEKEMSAVGLFLVIHRRTTWKGAAISGHSPSANVMSYRADAITQQYRGGALHLYVDWQKLFSREGLEEQPLAPALWVSSPGLSVTRTSSSTTFDLSSAHLSEGQVPLRFSLIDSYDGECMGIEDVAIRPIEGTEIPDVIIVRLNDQMLYPKTEDEPVMTM
ncbi:MAG: 30S ribosomal protein S16 [Fimbriimonadaceae bacterium]|nr:30S ribosomal protein S16 [Fimbriimonadaceae bacterium]